MSYDVEIQAGYKTIIKVNPSIMKMDPDLKSKLSIAKRSCRFSDEIPENMTMFNKYSLSACRFDCMMKFRYTVQYSMLYVKSFLLTSPVSQMDKICSKLSFPQK